MPNTIKLKMNLKTPITYYGWKQTLCPHILKMIPKHDLYVEPFCGGGAVFRAKEPSSIEVLNDHNRAVMAFYRVLKSDYELLAKHVKATLHSRSEHQKATQVLNHIDEHTDLQIARAFRVHTSMSYGSKLFGAFGYDLKRPATPRKIFFKKLNFSAQLSERLEKVTLECDDALKIIKRYDTENTFLYLDPPYLNCNQWHYAGYQESDFQALLDLLPTLKGKFLLSNYPSELLRSYTEKYKRPVFQIKKALSVNHKTRGKHVTEVLTGNYDLASVMVQHGA